MIDNRMRFIRLLESTEPREYIAEYEFASEVRITGELRYSNNNLILRLLTTEPNRDGLLKYTLSLSAPAEYRLPQYQASKGGYHFEGGDAEEILSLVSLFFRSRFFLVARVFRDVEAKLPVLRKQGIVCLPITKYEYDFYYIRPQNDADRNLFNSFDRNFGALDKFFDELRKLPEDLHDRFANAARLYALALREIGANDQLAYVHLVSAIEILSSYQVLSIEHDPLQNAIDQMKGVLNTTAEKEELEALLKNRKALMKFIVFIRGHSQKVIIKKPKDGALEHKVYQGEGLQKALRKIYNGRSKFLHEGASMYLSDPRLARAGYDYDLSMGQTIDNRKFFLKDKLPVISFFEDLVRACLLEYLRKNSSGESGAAG